MRKNVAKLLIAVMAMLSVSTNAAAADPCTHQWSSWTTAQAATCTKTGLSSRTCSLCKISENQTIPATDIHKWSNWKVKKSATISKKGSQTHSCLSCGKSETRTVAKLKPFVKFSKKKIELRKSQKQKLKISYAKGDKIKKWKSHSQEKRHGQDYRYDEIWQKSNLYRKGCHQEKIVKQQFIKKRSRLLDFRWICIS